MLGGASCGWFFFEALRWSRTTSILEAVSYNHVDIDVHCPKRRIDATLPVRESKVAPNSLPKKSFQFRLPTLFCDFPFTNQTRFHPLCYVLPLFDVQKIEFRSGTYDSRLNG